MLKRQTGYSHGFDAASASGMAFLQAQLELPNTKLVEPLASVTHPRDIPIKTGGGYLEYLSAYASDYADSGGNALGLIGTSNTDVSIIQASIAKGVWPAFNWQKAMRISYIDLQKADQRESARNPGSFLDSGHPRQRNQAHLEQGTRLPDLPRVARTARIDK